MNKTLKFYIQYFILIIAIGISIMGYFSALSYFWSEFKNSPFGYETCGLEGIVWLIFIPPVLGIAFILKIILAYFYQYPKILWISPIFTATLLFMFTLDKGLRQGIMAISFIIWEIIIGVYSAIYAEKINSRI